VSPAVAAHVVDRSRSQLGVKVEGIAWNKVMAGLLAQTVITAVFGRSRFCRLIGLFLVLAFAATALLFSRNSPDVNAVVDADPVVDVYVVDTTSARPTVSLAHLHAAILTLPALGRPRNVKQSSLRSYEGGTMIGGLSTNDLLAVHSDVLVRADNVAPKGSLPTSALLTTRLYFAFGGSGATHAISACSGSSLDVAARMWQPG